MYNIIKIDEDAYGERKSIVATYNTKAEADNYLLNKYNEMTDDVMHAYITAHKERNDNEHIELRENDDEVELNTTINNSPYMFHGAMRRDDEVKIGYSNHLSNTSFCEIYKIEEIKKGEKA